jgi:Tol biopolymer transport system component
MNPDGTHVRVLVKGGGKGEVCCGHPVLSPDGTELAYEGPEGTLVMTTVDGKHNFSPPHQFPGFGSSPAWSPRGDELAFISHDGSIRVVNADGTGVRTVFRAPDVGAGGLAWSPDGTELAFATRPRGSPIPSGNIDVVATSGGPAHTLVTGVLDGATGLSWAPGPDLLFTSMHEAVIFEAGRARGGHPVSSLYGRGSDVSPSWGPDGVHFLFVKADRVVIATVAGGVQTTIGPAGVSYAQWSVPR